MEDPWRVAEILFWAGAFVVAYGYFLYPLTIAMLARWRPWPMREDGPEPVSVSVVVAAYNEEATIGRRLRELDEEPGV